MTGKESSNLLYGENNTFILWFKAADFLSNCSNFSIAEGDLSYFDNQPSFLELVKVAPHWHFHLSFAARAWQIRFKKIYPSKFISLHCALAAALLLPKRWLIIFVLCDAIGLCIFIPSTAHVYMYVLHSMYTALDQDLVVRKGSTNLFK